MVSRIVLFLFLSVLCSATTPMPRRLNHKGKELFLNGINVAWAIAPGFCSDINFLDPDCQSSACSLDTEYFESMFKDVHLNGGNSLRFWLHADGSVIPVVNNDYSQRIVANITTTQLASVKWVLDLGKKYDILVNLCLWSFDMVNDWGYGGGYGLWNKIVTNDKNMDSYIDNWLTPLVKHIYDHDNLLSLEVFNEPEGMIEGWAWTNCQSHSSDCALVSVEQAQRFANRVAAAIHDVCAEVKVTVGSWSYIAASNVLQHTNIWSDEALVAAGGRTNGCLDYYQVHYYNWAYPTYSPFLQPATHWAALDKPHVIGEFPSNPQGVANPMFYEDLYLRGYAGAWGW